MAPHASALNFERRGSGPPLVLLHGLGGEWQNWSPVIDALATQRDVIAVDLPGFGLSQSLPDDGVPTPAALGVEVGRLMAELGIERPHVAGNSLGGWVALAMAKAGAVRSVTAIAPAGMWLHPLRPKPRITAQTIARALRPALSALVRSKRGRRIALAATVAHPERMTDEQALRMVRAYADAPGFVATNVEMRSSRFTGGEEIDVPVTIAWCEKDRLVARPGPPAFDYRETVLRDCGHVPMTDDPAAVAGVVLEGSAKGLLLAHEHSGPGDAPLRDGGTVSGTG